MQLLSWHKMSRIISLKGILLSKMMGSVIWNKVLRIWVIIELMSRHKSLLVLQLIDHRKVTVLPVELHEVRIHVVKHRIVHHVRMRRWHHHHRLGIHSRIKGCVSWEGHHFSTRIYQNRTQRWSVVRKVSLFDRILIVVLSPFLVHGWTTRDI